MPVRIMVGEIVLLSMAASMRQTDQMSDVPHAACEVGFHPLDRSLSRFHSQYTMFLMFLFYSHNKPLAVSVTLDFLGKFSGLNRQFPRH